MALAVRTSRVVRGIAAASSAVLASFGIALSVTSTAHAAPTDVQFFLPTYGVTAAPPYMLSSAVGGWVIAQTDLLRPKILVKGSGKPLIWTVWRRFVVMDLCATVFSH
ncbi:MAG: hypothetical protein EOP30_10565 [Rhodococcus sp. (in: high G+C Gram-positive bacteria)]|nr:MAG: hypothetical protein EOP30_10565 [Rhodococcus sp. (in: high G+C Gram-positive bacteria)]